MVKLLLKANAHILQTDGFGATALIYAAKDGHEAVVRLLLEVYAVINSRYLISTKDLFNMTALDCAVVEGHDAIAKLIKDSQAIGDHLRNCSVPISMESIRKAIRNLRVASGDTEEIRERLI
jgi:ankyrin repeat protein